jgi:hypothetical protein
VDEAAEQQFGRGSDKRALPAGEEDRPIVLLSGSVLWKEARP